MANMEQVKEFIKWILKIIYITFSVLFTTYYWARRAVEAACEEFNSWFYYKKPVIEIVEDPDGFDLLSCVLDMIRDMNIIYKLSYAKNVLVALLLALLIIIVVVIIYVVVRGFFRMTFCTKVIRYSYNRMYGIVGEATIPGSSFRAADPPKFQVSLGVMGLFGYTHVGYGLRVKNILITPVHVIAGKNEMIMNNNGIKMAIDIGGNVKYSEIVTDVAYVYLPASLWAKMGVSSAKQTRVGVSAMVSCSGPSGTSTGNMHRTSVAGVLEYEGSTEPGYSGAAYYIGNVVYGMHIGATMTLNTGVFSGVFMTEVDKFVWPEAKNYGRKSGKNVRRQQVNRRANMQVQKSDIDHGSNDLAGRASEEFDDGNDDWDWDTINQMEPEDFGRVDWSSLMIESTQPIELANQVRTLTSAERKKLKAAVDVADSADTIEASGLFVTPQGNGDQPEIMLASNIKPGTNIGTRVLQLEKFVKQLVPRHNFIITVERALHNIIRGYHPDTIEWPKQPFETPISYPVADIAINFDNRKPEVVEKSGLEKPTVSVRDMIADLEKVRCTICKRTFKDRKALHQHEKDAHGPKTIVVGTDNTKVTPESAYAQDFKKVIKTSSFLGQAKNQPTNSSRKLRNSSSSSDLSILFQSLVENQLKVHSLMQKISKSLNDLPRDMDGQDLDIMQN